MQMLFFHVRDKIRTRDLLVRSQTLYPAELHVHSLLFLNSKYYYSECNWFCQHDFLK